MISLAKPTEPPNLRTYSPTRCGTTLALLAWRRVVACAPQLGGAQNGHGTWARKIPFERLQVIAERLALAVHRAWIGIEVVLGGQRFQEALPAPSPGEAGGLAQAVRDLLASIPLGPLDQADRQSVRSAWDALIAARKVDYLTAHAADLAARLAESVPSPAPAPEASLVAEAGALDLLGEECEEGGHVGLCPLLRLRWKGRESLLVSLIAALFRNDLELNPPLPESPPPAGRPSAGARVRFAEMLVRHEAALVRLLDEFQAQADGEPASAGGDPAAKLQAGRSALRGGRYDEAVAAFTEAIRLSRACLEAHVLRADAYRHRGDYPHALASLHDAHRLAPADATVLFNRGVMHRLLDHRDAAVEDFSAVLQIDPGHTLAYTRRAGVYLEQGRREPALEDLSRALRLDPSCCLAYQTRGDLLVLEKRYDQAIADYTQVIRRTPCCVDAHLRRGDVYQAKREFERAVADYTQAIRFDPLHIPGYVRRAAAYHQNAKYTLAVTDLNAAARLEPGNAEVYHHRGLAQRELKDARAALADFGRALQLHRAAPHSFERGRTHEILNDLDAALADFDTAIALDPLSPTYRRTRGGLLVRRGQVDRAIEDFTSAIRLDDRVGLAFVDRAEAWIEKGRFDKAVEDCDSALGCDPRLPAAYSTRGKAHAQQGDHAAAGDDFDQALALAPRDARAYQLRAQAALSQGDYEKALRDLGRSLELSPSNAVACFLRGTALRALDRQAEALADFNKAMLLDASYTAVYCNQRASLHAAASEFGQALADYAIVLQLDPCNLAAVAGREQVQAALAAGAVEGGRPAAPKPPSAKRGGRRRDTPSPPTMVHPVGVATGEAPAVESAPEEASYFEPEPVLEAPAQAPEDLPDQAEPPPTRPDSSEATAEVKPPRGVGPVEARASKELRKEEMEDRARQWAEKVHRERQEALGGSFVPKPATVKQKPDRGPLLAMLLKVTVAVIVLGALGGGGYYAFQAREPRLASAEVWEEFQADTDTTNAKYKGQFVQLTGKIKSYPVGKTSRWFFEFPKDGKWGIECALRQAELKTLKDGQTITVRGRFSPRRKGAASNVSMSNCNLLKVLE